MNTKDNPLNFSEAEVELLVSMGVLLTKHADSKDSGKIFFTSGTLAISAGFLALVLGVFFSEDKDISSGFTVCGIVLGSSFLAFWGLISLVVKKRYALAKDKVMAKKDGITSLKESIQRKSKQVECFEIRFFDGENPASSEDELIEMFSASLQESRLSMRQLLIDLERRVSEVQKLL